ncbi:hypothetical protein N5K21_28125 [Rhizobium pusense]|uniref:Metallophosphoesterase n=1 Tax=Agrobacterium pusense TaxID=648995 RepID=A0A6H0ZIG5_9HYPH|nr:hypothetical protein [Agrobacterium pusense]MDH2092579.1 hypothetical protein [Agrobacterium pusense]QIX19827.1 hypothetical protein FOB41_01275 [Agrobacterium pusense]WCK27609.1 hypothetical protein CFBP5496_0024875 [Agrobacterium pusense]
MTKHERNLLPAGTSPAIDGPTTEAETPAGANSQVQQAEEYPNGINPHWDVALIATRGHVLSARIEWLAKVFTGPATLAAIVTSPHKMSVAEEYANDPLTPAFASDFDREIAEFEPYFWIHGHTHTGFDYTVPGARTRVICNPLGYRIGAARVSNIFENPAFDPYKTIGIPLTK